MSTALTEQQAERREQARRFASREIAPWADRIDREQRTPRSVLDAVRAGGYLGAGLPELWGGGGFDPVSYGLVTEEVGKACSSVRSLMTVHNMAAQALARLGTPEQRERWLPALCAGERIIGFALSEPGVGSAAHEVATEAVDRGGAFLLTGTKKWITYGQVADLFLVFARCDGKPTAFIVERGSEGLAVLPIGDVIGTRGAMLAELRMDAVPVPASHQVGQRGMGAAFVANLALDHGRRSVAWGTTGIIHACLDACVAYAEQRWQGGRALREHQLVRRKLADMLVAHTAARALCHRSACLHEQHDPRAVMETCTAKYFAAEAAVRVATDAVHLHGANGCAADHPVSRYLRDATVMGVIEGTAEIHQLALSDYAFQRPYLR
ncbi:acyl-CoA dehydrogenase family protein [Actinokineospora sp. NPDC004072]